MSRTDARTATPDADVAADNERLRLALALATREIALLRRMQDCVERRGSSFGIRVNDDRIALEYQKLDDEREPLRKAREAKLRTLSGGELRWECYACDGVWCGTPACPECGCIGLPLALASLPEEPK